MKAAAGPDKGSARPQLIPEPPLEPVNIAAKFFCAAVLGGNVFLVSSVQEAQSATQPSVADPARGARWTDIGCRVESEQRRLLGETLDRYREIERSGGWGKVPTDLLMGPGYSYDCVRIARLEQRLIVEGYLGSGSTAPPGRDEKPIAEGGPCEYGPELTDAVRAFQADRNILGAGQLGRQTIAELNRPVREFVDILERDVARWRKLFLDPSGTYLLVNIPFFELSLYENGRESARMPVIVGQPTWQTPLFSDELEYLIVNPDWGIPDKIAKQEYWPTARRDADYLRRQGITASGQGLRQKPGPRNPLGRVKFVMPNKNDVYLHDTPEKGAFAAAVKALSHGCIRLSHPLDLANYLLRGEPQWAPRRLEAAIASGKTLQVDLARHMPVHIIYSTSRVNERGRVEFRPDVYGKNGSAAAQAEPPRHPADEPLDSWP